MKVVCSLCGCEAESDVEIADGQRVECPSCGQVFVHKRTRPTRIPLPVQENPQSKSKGSGKSLVTRLIAPFQKCHWMAVGDAPWQVQIAVLLVVVPPVVDFAWRIATGDISVQLALFDIGLPVLLAPLLLYSSRIRWLAVILCGLAFVFGMSDGCFSDVIAPGLITALLLSKPAFEWYQEKHVATCRRTVAELALSVFKNVCMNVCRRYVMSSVVVIACIALWFAGTHSSRSDGGWQSERATVDFNGDGADKDDMGKLRAWYNDQLRHYGFSEINFVRDVDAKNGNSYYIDLDDGGAPTQIKLENMQYFSHPRSIPRGAAEKMMKARIRIAEAEYRN